mmetsp:Transcript_20064/g.41980  ORF Transcript_20064/g.41980 Transcript_20064/m.41980 type:complete len:222 (-) Transcript_20064:349-1014(-)
MSSSSEENPPSSPPARIIGLANFVSSMAFSDDIILTSSIFTSTVDSTTYLWTVVLCLCPIRHTRLIAWESSALLSKGSSISTCLASRMVSPSAPFFTLSIKTVVSLERKIFRASPIFAKETDLTKETSFDRSASSTISSISSHCENKMAFSPRSLISNRSDTTFVTFVPQLPLTFRFIEEPSSLGFSEAIKTSSVVVRSLQRIGQLMLRCPVLSPSRQGFR